MGRHNVHSRFVHRIAQAEYASMPARLRMTVIGNPGIARADFELCSLAVSAINGCGACRLAHERQVRRQSRGGEAVHNAVRIAATVHAVARVSANARAGTLTQQAQAAA